MGDNLSNSFTSNSPCFSVHMRSGDPPPISLYFSATLGVLRLAILGARILWKHANDSQSQ